MLSENDPDLPQLVRNYHAVNRELGAEVRADHMTGRLAAAVKVAQEFEKQCGSESFYGYPVPYSGSGLTTPKSLRFRTKLLMGDDSGAAIQHDKDLKGDCETLVRGIVEELAETFEGQIIFPCLLDVAGVFIDPQTFHPCMRFELLYHSSPTEITPPIDFTNAPAVSL